MPLPNTFDPIKNNMHESSIARRIQLQNCCPQTDVRPFVCESRYLSNLHVTGRHHVFLRTRTLNPVHIQFNYMILRSLLNRGHYIPRPRARHSCKYEIRLFDRSIKHSVGLNIVFFSLVPSYPLVSRYITNN